MQEEFLKENKIIENQNMRRRLCLVGSRARTGTQALQG